MKFQSNVSICHRLLKTWRLSRSFPLSNLASESIKWNDSEAVLKSHSDHIENKEVKQGLEITNGMKSICTIMKKTPDSHSGKPYILDISLIPTVKNINLSVAWPGVSCKLTWAASPSGVWGQLKNPQQLTVKHLQLALTQSHPETKTSQPPWRSGSCLDLASNDICHCQACRHTCPSVTNNCMSHSRMRHTQGFANMPSDQSWTLYIRNISWALLKTLMFWTDSGLHRN